MTQAAGNLLFRVDQDVPWLKLRAPSEHGQLASAELW
jgi:hypothetical protein